MFVRDLRLASRMWWNNRGVATVATLTIALAVGASVAVFSVVHAVLLEPLPMAGQDRLVKLWKEDVQRDFDDIPVLYPEYEQWRDHNQVFDGIAAIIAEGTWPLTFRDGGEPSMIEATHVSPGFFEMLGVGGGGGRLFLPEDGTPESPRVALLSHDAWQRRFGGDPDVLGRSVEIHNRETTIVGVVAAGFDYPEGVELYLPVRGENWLELDAIGRLKEGMTLEQAHEDISLISERHASDKWEYLKSQTVVARPLVETIVGEVSTALWVMLGTVGFLLAIACANVANLLLVKAGGRRQQLSIRAALGASRQQLVRQLSIENLLLALAGGGLGVLVAWGSLKLLPILNPGAVPRSAEIGIDPAVLGFALLVILATAAAFGLVPAMKASSVRLASSIQGGGRGSSQGASDHRMMGRLVVVEVGLALVLLIGAGLLARSFARLQQLEPGFDAESLLSVKMALLGQDYRGTLRLDFYDRLVPEIEALPEVAAATPVLTRPFAMHKGYDMGFVLEGQSPDEVEANPWVNYEAVAPNYFEAMGIALLRGRGITAQDDQDAPPVTVVNEAMAERFWPGQEAIGKRLRPAAPDAPWVTVVGVSANVRYRDLTRVRPGIHIPFRQSIFMPQYLMIRANGDPASAVAPVRRRIREMEPNVPLDDMETISSLMSERLSTPRFNTLLLAALAGMALLIAVIGIYGVMGSLVAFRGREFGVRITFGARPRDILSNVLVRGLVLAGAGVALGLAGALILTRVLGSLLFEVSTVDLATFASVSVLLLAAALLAAYVPARRATRVDPVVVLREE